MLRMLKKKFILLLRKYIRRNIKSIDSLALLFEELQEIETRLVRLQICRRKAIAVNQQEVFDLETILTHTKDRVQGENAKHSSIINVIVGATANVAAAIPKTSIEES